MNDEIVDGYPNREKYLKYENLYKKYFEVYVFSLVNLKKYDDLINNSELGFGLVKGNIQLKSQLNEYLNLNHIYILNNFYVEKLNGEELEILNSNNNEEVLALIKRTYKEIIKYTRENQNMRFKINYTNSSSEDVLSFNDELVIHIYYGSNTKKYNTKEAYLKNYIEKKEFLEQLKNQISIEIKQKLDIDSSILFKKI